MPIPRRWTLFCTVIDNYGDVGVCWRLARQLVRDFGLEVELRLDALEALQHLWPATDPARADQILDGVRVLRWDADTPVGEVGDVVIEAFACELPEAYLAAMAARATAPVWINLEYLSAEDWVGDCHGLPSRHPRLGLDKYFYFPGFTAYTGGVLGERDLTRRRRDFQDDAEAQAAFLRGIGVEPVVGARRISLFAYENAGVAGLVAAWRASPVPIQVLVPEGRVLPGIAEALGRDALHAGQRVVEGALSLDVLPFLGQDDYDRLLWACDLNFVRGEDSFVRAQWAARPLVWHIYRQDENAHWDKLTAFLRRYEAGLAEPARAALSELWYAWNWEREVGPAWEACGTAWQALEQHARTWAGNLDQAEDLASGLVRFCTDKV